MPEPLTHLKQSFAFLEAEHGLTLESEIIGESFDNLALEYRSARFRVRVDRDRGQILVSFGPALGVPAYWFGLELILEWLGEREDHEALVSSDYRESQVVAALARRHIDRIALLFAPARYPETKRQLGEFAEARAERLFGWRSRSK